MIHLVFPIYGSGLIGSELLCWPTCCSAEAEVQGVLWPLIGWLYNIEDMHLLSTKLQQHVQTAQAR